MSSNFSGQIIGQSAAQTEGSTNTGNGAYILDVTQQTFMTDVVDASNDIPVLVDFWAPWCGPCRQLTPVLEKVVTAAAGRVRLAKVDIEANKTLAAQLGQMGLPLQSIPVVVAFWKGQVLDLFQGAQKESEIRRFVESLLKLSGGAMPATELLAAGKTALSEDRMEEAAGLFAQVLETEAENPEAWSGMIRALIQLGETDSAEEAIAQIPEKLNTHPEITGAKAALALHRESQTAAAELDGLRAAVAANPEDFGLKMKLAGAFNGTGAREDAARELLDIIRADRNWEEGAARTELLRFFEAWGHTDPVTLAARRKLSSLLFS